MTSKSARKRAKRNRISLSGGETVNAPRGQGMRAAQVAPDVEPLKARAIRNSLANPADARLPWFGCVAGQAMAGAVSKHADRLPLWDAIQHIRRTVAAYDRAMCAPSRHAKVARILSPVSAMESDASSPPLDERSDEQKQDHAEEAISRLYEALRGVDDDTAADCLRVVAEDAPCRSPAGLVAALGCVAGMMAGIAPPVAKVQDRITTT